MPVSSTQSTDLVLTGPYVPRYSARDLTQTLEPIEDASQLRRTVNGDLDDVSAAKFRKYKSTISGDDVDPPALDGWWPGMEVTVDCLYELSYLTISGLPSRTVVEDSSRLVGDFTLYRPRLQMRITKYSQERSEWQARNRWTIELEEI